MLRKHERIGLCISVCLSARPGLITGWIAAPSEKTLFHAGLIWHLRSAFKQFTIIHDVNCLTKNESLYIMSRTRAGSQSPQRQHCPKSGRFRLSIITMSLSMSRLGLWWVEDQNTNNKGIVSPGNYCDADFHQRTTRQPLVLNRQALTRRHNVFRLLLAWTFRGIKTKLLPFLIPEIKQRQSPLA